MRRSIRSMWTLIIMGPGKSFFGIEVKGAFEKLPAGYSPHRSLPASIRSSTRSISSTMLIPAVPLIGTLPTSLR